jgi:hypothetical protein
MERPGYDPFPQRDLGWCSYALLRPTIERTVRSRVEGQPNTTLRQRCRVQESWRLQMERRSPACVTRTPMTQAR